MAGREEVVRGGGGGSTATVNSSALLPPQFISPLFLILTNLFQCPFLSSIPITNHMKQKLNKTTKILLSKKGLSRIRSTNYGTPLKSKNRCYP